MDLLVVPLACKDAYAYGTKGTNYPRDCTCLLVGRLQFPVIMDMASDPGIS